MEATDNDSGERVMVKYLHELEFSSWEDEYLHDKNGEVLSLEFWIRKVVKIRNECSHDQREKMTEQILVEKFNHMKETLQNLIQRMKTHYHYPDSLSKDKIDKLEAIVKDRKISVPIWKDFTDSVECRLMEKVFECISHDKETDIRLPALDNEHINLDVPPSKVYLTIRGKGSDERKIASTNVVKELMDTQRFPKRCLVLVGLPGVGKTTSLFRIKEEHKNAIKNKNMDVKYEFEQVEDIEILIYQALRDNGHRSLLELLHYKFGAATEMIIPHSSQLQQILLKRPSILLLDAIDESTTVSDQLVRDIWKIKDNFPNLYMIFTTRGSAGTSNVLRECAGDDYDSMCINVTGLDPSEFLENSGKLIDVILEDGKGRRKNLEKRKLEAMSNLQKIRQKFPPIGTNPLLLTIAVRLVLDPFIDTVDKLQSTTQLIKGMMDSLKRRLCDRIEIDAHVVDEYLDFLGNESLSMFQRKEFMLDSESTERLIDKMNSLKIEQECFEKVLQSFLTKKGENSFQHLHAVTQSFLAANALLKKLMKLSKQELNHEIDNQIKDIPKEHTQTILMFIVGILHDNEEHEYLNTIALVICKYFEFPRFNFFDALKTTQLHLFQESLAGGCGIPNEILERETLSKAPDSIEVGEEPLEAIRYMMNKDEKKFWPKEIRILTQSQPDTMINLMPVLELLNQRNSCLDLTVNCCSEDLLRNLPENLEKLKVEWTLGEVDKMTYAINTRLPSLNKLFMLTIVLNEGGSFKEEAIPKLCYGGDLLVIHLEGKFNDNEVTKAALIFERACSQRDHQIIGLDLGGSRLSGSGCGKLLEELSRLDVKAHWLKIGYAQLAEGEREYLQKKAENSGIRLFVPPGQNFIERFQATSFIFKAFKSYPNFTMDFTEAILEILSSTDQLQSATLGRLLKAYTNSSSAFEMLKLTDSSAGNSSSAFEQLKLTDSSAGNSSSTFEQLQLSDSSAGNKTLKDNLISSISELVQAMRVADPARFQSMFKKLITVFSNKAIQSSNFDGYMGIYRDMMRALSANGIPEDTAGDLAISIGLSTALSKFSSDRNPTSRIVSNTVAGGRDIVSGVRSIISSFSNNNNATNRPMVTAVAGGRDILRGLTTLVTSFAREDGPTDTTVATADTSGMENLRSSAPPEEADFDLD